MIGQPQNHRRRSLVIAMHSIPTQRPQSLMSSLEVVIEELQAHERIPGGIAFGKRMGLAGERIEPIMQGAVESFDMHRASWLHPRPSAARISTDNSRPCSSRCLTVCINVTVSGTTNGGRPRLPVNTRLSIGLHKHVLIAVPPRTPPVKLTLVGPLDGGGHRLLDQVLTQWTGGAGNHEATVSILDEASPAFSCVRLPICAVFFCIHDQNSSISTWLRCRSAASTCVRTSAWVAARFSHTLMVSYVWPVIPKPSPRT